MMKHMRYSLFLSLLAAGWTTVGAQINNNIVEVENNYRPTVKDADKLDVLPRVERMETKHYDVDYDITQLTTDKYAPQPLFSVRADQIVTGVPRDFLTFNVGNRGIFNTRGTFGLKLTDADRMDLDLSLRRHSSNLEDPLKTTEKGEWLSNVLTLKGAIDYEHKLNSLSSIFVSGGAMYQSLYYGPFAFISPLQNHPILSENDLDKKQKNTLANIGMTLTPYDFGKLVLSGHLNYTMFDQSLLTNDIGSYLSNHEMQALAGVDASVKLGERQSVGLGIDVGSSSYGYEGFLNNNSMTLRPHYDVRSGRCLLTIGALFYRTWGLLQEWEVAPDVQLKLHASPRMDITAMLSGGEVRNDYRHFQEMTPYWHVTSFIDPYAGCKNVSDGQLAHQFDNLRASAAVEWNPTNRIFLSVGGGYEASSQRAEMFADGRLFAADGSRAHFDAEFKYYGNEWFRLNAKLQCNGWSSDAEGILGDNATSWRPIVDLRADTRLRLVRNLYFGADLMFQTFEKGKELYYERPNIADVGCSLAFKMPFDKERLDGGAFSVYMRADNVFNQKYDLYNMYRSFGSSILFGTALTF